MTLFLKKSDKNFDESFSRFLMLKRENSIDVSETVSEIICNVRKNGDKSLLDYTAKYDKLVLTGESMLVSEQEIQDAVKECDQKTLNALYLAAERIEAFHNQQIPNSKLFNDETGALMGWRWTAVQSAGLYVPGGTAAYPSSVLMNAIPAKVAGVKRIVMVVPSPNGKLNPLVLAAADCVGITEIYRIGGAQAVAALAYGTETIKPVDMIVGPGNAYVAAAKRQVFGKVGIDMIAGPSEIMVVADDTANPEWVAADLLSQAEHDKSAQAILVTNSLKLYDEIDEIVKKQINDLDRHEIALQSWMDNGAVLYIEDLTKVGEIIDAVAPEHLELSVSDAEGICKYVHNAGAIFLGYHTPEAMGDYIGGPNHVLPTARNAKFSSGLGVLSFMKRTTILSCVQDTIDKLGEDAVLLAKAEGLTAHAKSILTRMK
ncbi:MAG: histidinol dehydrogenase [Alphaproteobacteria bacterium]|nr:histidinol dehydrogenase [Alphaproteobacteria bacterium]